MFLFISLLSFANAFAQPVANFYASTTSGCAPFIVQFTNTSTGATSYQWDFGNATTSVLANPSVSYTHAGTYTVKLIAYNGANSNTKTITNYITVYDTPTVVFNTVDTAGCPGLPVHFTNNSNPQTPGPATYNWDFGDGFLSTQQTPTHIYYTPGYYNVTLSVVNSQHCISTVVRNNLVHIFTPPVANFNTPTTIFCSAPVTVTFANTSTGFNPLTYAWDFGDLTTSTQTNPPPHTYANPASYTVTLVATDGHGCKDTQKNVNYITVQNYNGSFTGPTSICEQDTALFTNTSPPPTNNSSWDFGDGGTASGTTTKHIYTTPGTYTVRLITLGGTCFDTIYHNITVHPKPTIDFNFSPSPPCPPPITLQFNNLTVNGNTYAWDFGDGGTSTLINPTHLYTNNGPYDVQLIATSSFGCKDTLFRDDYIKLENFAVFALRDTGGCAPVTVHFRDSTTYTQPIVSWHWDFGDMTSSTLPDPTHTYTIPGLYTVVLKVTSANGCTAYDTIEVGAGTHPHADFTAYPSPVCVNQPVFFENHSTGATDYVWILGDNIDTSTNPVHYYHYDTTYTITLIALNYGCPDTLTIPNMITVHPPTAHYAVYYSCDTPTKVTFVNQSHNYTSFIWYFGDNTSNSVDTSPSHTYATLGDYNVMLVTFNNVYGCSDTSILPIWTFKPTAIITSPDTAICLNDTGTLTATIIGTFGHPTNHYTWQIGAWVSGDTTLTIKYKFQQSGYYTITFSFMDAHGCIQSVTRTNYMLVSKPDANFTATPLQGCVPLNVTFTDNSVNLPGTFDVTRNWDFGNGTANVNTPSVSHSYINPGYYSVQLVVTDNVGCKDTIIKPNYILGIKPTAAMQVNNFYPCVGTSVTFTNTSSALTPLTSVWDFGDNTTSTDVSPHHTYTQTGTYTITLIVTDTYGCKDTATLQFITVTKPVASFTMSDSISLCPPMQVSYNSTSTGASTYAWDFGNNNTSVIPTPSNLYTTSGNYTVRLIAIDSHGCADTAYDQVNIYGGGATFSYAPLAGCAPLEVNFTANVSNIPFIAWDFSDGTVTPSSPSTTATHIYTQPGAYVPKLILSDNTGCQTSSTGIDTIKVDGFITAYSYQPYPACEKETIYFSDSSKSFFSSITTWHWQFDDGQTSDIANPDHYYNTPGDHPVVLIVSNANGCTDTLSNTITIHALPTITASGDTVVCLGDAGRLEASGGANYTWSPATGLSCTNCPATYASPQVPTIYTVTGSDEFGCKNTDSAKVTLKYKTTSTVGQGGEICEDDKLQLSVSGAHRYVWTPANTLDDATSANPTSTPKYTTNYMVIAYEGSCIPDTNFVMVTVHAKPTVDAGKDQTVLAGSSADLHFTGSGYAKFAWDADATLSCVDCKDPVATPINTTIYVVTAESDFGCKRSDDVKITVLCDNSLLFIPNSFTPNGDGENDVFYPRGNGVTLIKTFRVFDRWGEKVFERQGISINDASNGWDGTFRGNKLSPDVYVYIVDAVCQTGEMINVKGDITIIR